METLDNIVHFYFRFSSDAWRRRRRRRRNGLQMDDNDINPADLKKDMFPDELPEGAPSSLFDEPLEDEDDKTPELHYTELCYKWHCSV